jgi:hypothetical protein
VDAPPPSPAPNFRRRFVGVVVCLAPLFLLLLSLAYALARGLNADSGMSMSCVTLAAAVAGLNFFLSFVRPLLHRLRHRSMDGYRHASGFPLLGMILVVAGAVTGFGGFWTALIGLIALLVDVGGPHWFLWATWNDSTLWDA